MRVVAAAAAGSSQGQARQKGAPEPQRGPLWTVAQLRRRCGGLTAPELARRAGVPLRTVYLMEIGGAVSWEEARRVLSVLRERLACCGLGEIEVVGGFIVSEELQRQAWRVLTESDFRLFVYGSQVPLPPLAEAGAGTGTGTGTGRGAGTGAGSDAGHDAATDAGRGAGTGASTGTGRGEAEVGPVLGQAGPDTGRDMRRGIAEAEAEGMIRGGSALGADAAGEEGERGAEQVEQVQTRPLSVGAVASSASVSAGAARLGRWVRSQRLSKIPFP
ncbi:hypothetical protein [Thermogemmatispora onikobensis]|uniref:hypothetical protein n=1 Tax=Thermogemmatispora onikobensis TaxID=732234 RepID=UPI00114CB14E|nr:hypothetical protein [Thermogemmatispora onikobensis]